MAQKLLLGSGQSVTEICALAGYSNLPHFVRTFKQVTGYTPTAYRQENKKSPETEAADASSESGISDKNESDSEG